MKKSYIVLSVFFLFLSTSVMAQGPWTFTGSNDIWASTGTAADLTTDPTYSVLDINGAGNPQIVATTANVDATNIYAIIKIQNNTSNTRMRIIYNTSGSNRFVDTDISANDSSVKMYYVKCDANADWAGTVNNITVQFKSNSSNSPAVDDGLGTFFIDDITMTSVPQTLPSRLDYTFDDVSDVEGFVGKNGITLSQPTVGEIQLTIDASNNFPKFEQVATFSVDADTYKGVRVTLINDSPKNKLTLTTGGGQFSTSDISIQNDNTTVQTIEIDLSANTNWTGTKSNWWFQLVDNPGSAQPSAGTITIQQILFTATPLSISEVDLKDDPSIGLYPNPVNDVFKLNSPRRIEKIEVYNVLGQQQDLKFQNSNTVNASSLSTGIYILKVYQENNKISTKRFIKN